MDLLQSSLRSVLNIYFDCIYGSLIYLARVIIFLVIYNEVKVYRVMMYANPLLIV